MSTITLQFNESNILAMSILRSIKSAGVFSIIEDKSVYSAEFINKIESGRADMKAGKGKAIKTEDLWK